MNTARGKAKPRTSEVGQDVIASLREIRAWQRGELTLRVTEAGDLTERGNGRGVTMSGKRRGD